jgi:hypothetical protein
MAGAFGFAAFFFTGFFAFVDFFADFFAMFSTSLC